MRNWVSNLAAMMLLAAPAAATPDRVSWVEDRLVARTGDTVMVPRMFRHTHGPHFTAQTDRPLLTFDIASSAVSTLWVVVLAFP